MLDNKQAETFSRLLMAHRRRIYGFIYTLTHDAAATDEILQEASVTLWRKFDQFKPGTDFGAWAMKVARYSVFEWRRKQARLPLPMDDELLLALSEQAMEAACDSEARIGAVGNCINKLKDRDRDLVNKRYADNLSVIEIAEGSGRTRGAVYKILNRIHRDLLDCVEEKLATEELA